MKSCAVEQHVKKMEKARQVRRTGRMTIVVRPAPGQKSRALVQCGNIVVPAAIGRSGRTIRKREGDGATPIATMSLLYGFVRSDNVRPPATSLPLVSIRPDMLWCDQPESGNYNRRVKAPFARSHETLLRQDGLYDICLVMDWNILSRRRNRGSAIFFHLIRPGYKPTEGCIAVSRAAMNRLLPHMRAGTRVRVL
jgi:L,D-peptidoglycan transpeptidase YkuD (ErfK/YbiS/YcfS/YnhG family)